MGAVPIASTINTLERSMIEKFFLRFKLYRNFVEKQEKKRIKYLGL